MFALFMAIIFGGAFIINGIYRNINVQHERKLAKINGWDHYHDINGVKVHVDDDLPYVYRCINGDCYEINPYDYKVRRNITKERDAAKLKVFRKIANEKGIRFVEDITSDGHKVYDEHMYNRNKTNTPCYRHRHLTSFKSFSFSPNAGIGYNALIDTVTGAKYLSYKRKFDNNNEYIPYLLNPATGYIDGVNIDLLNMDKTYRILTKNDGEVFAKPTKEMIEEELSIINEPVDRYYKNEIEKLAAESNMQEERNNIEEMISTEINNGRKRGEIYL